MPQRGCHACEQDAPIRYRSPSESCCFPAALAISCVDVETPSAGGTIVIAAAQWEATAQLLTSCVTGNGTVTFDMTRGSNTSLANAHLILELRSWTVTGAVNITIQLSDQALRNVTVLVVGMQADVDFRQHTNGSFLAISGTKGSISNVSLFVEVSIITAIGGASTVAVGSVTDCTTATGVSLVVRDSTWLLEGGAFVAAPTLLAASIQTDNQCAAVHRCVTHYGASRGCERVVDALGSGRHLHERGQLAQNVPVTVSRQSVVNVTSVATAFSGGLASLVRRRTTIRWWSGHEPIVRRQRPIQGPWRIARSEPVGASSPPSRRCEGGIRQQRPQRTKSYRTRFLSPRHT